VGGAPLNQWTPPGWPVLCAFSKALAALLLARTRCDNSWIDGKQEVMATGVSWNYFRIARHPTRKQTFR
jgi:hypothetical protein